MMSDDKDREVIAAATDGPWAFCPDSGLVFDRDGLDIIETNYGNYRYNARFVASARTRWPAALDEADSLRAQLQQANDKIAELERVREAARKFVDMRNDAPPEDRKMPMYLDYTGSAMAAALDDYQEKWGK